MALIAISGKIGSGKDTVGAIIQYLIWKQQVESSRVTSIHFTLKDFLEGRIKSDYELKKFAGKLKEICSLLTGIPVADFEKSSVKDSYLGEEWVKYGIDGDHDFSPDDYGYVLTYEDAVELANNIGEDVKFIQKYRMTVRELLQIVGTNALRNVLHPNIWVNALFQEYRGRELMTLKGEPLGLSYPSWIITDCRFPNEAKVVEDKSGILIRVVRPFDGPERTCTDCGAGFSLELMDSNNGLSPCCKNHNHIATEPKPSIHSSETALDDYSFKYVINNDGTIDDLVEKVKQVLIQTKIL